MNSLARINHQALSEYLLSFIHIPKTAGTSFTEVLMKVVGTTRFRVLYPSVLHGLSEPNLDINSYVGISGHFPYEIARLIYKPALFITFLREPLSRALSQFREYGRMDLEDPLIRRSENRAFFEQVRRMKFHEFIGHSFFEQLNSNLQTRMLGLVINEPVLHLRDLFPMDKSSTRSFSLELAKERLEKFVFFGIQERFQESLDLFSFQFDVPQNEKLPAKNISPDRFDSYELTDYAKEDFYKKNLLDTDLYKFAWELFAKRYNENKTLSTRRI